MNFISRAKIVAEKILQTIKEEKRKITYPIDPFKILNTNISNFKIYNIV